tara:strand:- start:10318 stop:11430 length:1113 start_codon:yes stop_codon:yes gene_type:complete
MLNQMKIKNILAKGLTAFVVFFFLSVSAYATTDPVKILFIGNSYTHMNDMPATVEKIAKSKGRNTQVKMSAVSSSTFQLHSERKELFNDIELEKWDYVILQGFSRELGQDIATIDSLSLPYIRKIIEAVYANNSCTQVMLYMTWGYENGYVHDERLDTYPKMSAKVEEGYAYISNKFSIPIVPVGQIYRQFRLDIPEIQLYESDSQHPTKTASYIIAATFFASIFNESPLNAYKGNIGLDEGVKIQNLIADFIDVNRNKYKLDVNTFSVSFYTSSVGEYEVDVRSNYPDARSLTWSFGDGNSSKFAHLKHIYKVAGEYDLQLTVEDSCGEKKFSRTVVFLIPPKETKIKWWQRKKKKRAKLESVLIGNEE